MPAYIKEKGFFLVLKVLFIFYCLKKKKRTMSRLSESNAAYVGIQGTQTRSILNFIETVRVSLQA